MGCDIHFYVERKDETGAWVSADEWEQEPDAHDETPYVPWEKQLYHERNYAVFAILADVRNGRSLFDMDGMYDDLYRPIDKPRGLPNDVTHNVKALSDLYGVDGHSHSWFTVAELLEYDWTQTVTRRGFVDAATFYQWERLARKHGENPNTWCVNVGGTRVRKISEDQMREWLARVAKENPGANVDTIEELRGVFTASEWRQPYYKPAERFLSETMPKLWRLGKPENVRIVFWFDN